MAEKVSGHIKIHLSADPPGKVTIEKHHYALEKEDSPPYHSKNKE